MWRPANNGSGKRMWFVMRDDPDKPGRFEYHWRKAAGPLRVVRYGSCEAAQAAADRLNASAAPPTHALVPVEALEYAADGLADVGGLYRNLYKPGTALGDRAEPTYALCHAFRAAARGERVEWPS